MQITVGQMGIRLGISCAKAYKIVRRADFYPVILGGERIMVDTDKLEIWMREETERKKRKAAESGKTLRDALQRFSLCWQCRNFSGGCSWSQDFTPVSGWDADFRPLKVFCGLEDDGTQRYRNETSYFVRKCPEFIADGSEGRKEQNIHNE